MPPNFGSGAFKLQLTKFLSPYRRFVDTIKERGVFDKMQEVSNRGTKKGEEGAPSEEGSY